MEQLAQPWPSCFWYSRKWFCPWRRVHPVLQGNRKGELHWHTPQPHLIPCVQGTTILCPSPALLQAKLQLNQCLQVVSVGASHPFSGRSGIRIAHLYPAPPFQSGFPFFSEQYIKPVLTISIHTNGRKTSALPLYCGLKMKGLTPFCVVCQSKQCYSQLAKPWETCTLQANHILLLHTMGKILVQTLFSELLVHLETEFLDIIFPFSASFSPLTQPNLIHNRWKRHTKVSMYILPRQILATLFNGNSLNWGL